MEQKLDHNPEEVLAKVNANLSSLMTSLLIEELNSQLEDLKDQAVSSDSALKDALAKSELLPNDGAGLEELREKINIIHSASIIRKNEVSIMADKVEVARRNIERISHMLQTKHQDLYDEETVKSLQVALQR